MRCLLAVDSGGTKCETLLVREDGVVLGSGRRDSRHHNGERHAGGHGRAEGTVAEAVAEAVSGVHGVVEYHVAGRPLPAETLQALGTQVTYHPVRECDAPMALVGATAGVVALAGTGAFAYGRTGGGEELLLDAIGPLYGDHGGAFQIGLAAVRAAGQASWHERYSTTLAEAIPLACKALSDDPQGFHMVTYMLQPRDRSEIASLAALVDAEAEKGDRIARQILKNAADDLSETVRCVVERLGLADAELPLIGTGSVAVHSRTYWGRLCETVRSFAPRLTPIKDDQPPAYGYILGMASLLGLDTAEFRARLFEERSQNPKP